MIVDDIVARVQGVPRPVVLIDGRSGSGKSTLASRVAARLAAQLVRLDDIYPGWSGLDAASRHVHDFVLDPLAPRWQRWDWTAQAPAEWHLLDPTLPLVVEGCGALSRANLSRASLGVWLELDEPSRRARALGRDTGDFALHWEHWAAQEAAFIARESPQLLATLPAPT